MYPVRSAAGLITHPLQSSCCIRIWWWYSKWCFADLCHLCCHIQRNLKISVHKKGNKQTNRFVNFICTIFAHFWHWQQPIIQFRKINWSSHMSCKTHLWKCIALVFLVKPIHENVQFSYSLKCPFMKMYSLSYTLQNPYMKMYSSHIPCKTHTWKRKKQSHLCYMKGM